MNRALRSAPWLFAAGAIALVVVGVGFQSLGGPAWRFALLGCGVVSLLIGIRANHMHWAFGVAVAVGGARVMFLHGHAAEPSSAGMIVDSLANIVTGVALMVVLGLALRFRRGSLNRRDGIDLLTVTFGAVTATWVLVTSRMIFVADWHPAVALLDTLYLPIAALLFTFVLDLLQTGLTSNRTMQLVTLAAAANLAAALVDAFDAADIWVAAPAGRISLFAASFLFLCAGLSHVDAPATIEPDTSVEPAVAYTPFRLAMTGACLVIPGIFVAALAPLGRADLTIRSIAVVIGVSTVLARLYIAVHSHEEANRTLTERLHLDELTQLPTRVPFVREVAAVLDSTWRSEFQPTIIQLNLDRFKNINDSLGYEDANDVLVIVAQRLAEAAVDFGGMVGRTGGDDFVIIDATTRSSDDALERLETIRAALREPVRVGDVSMFVTASFGVVTVPRNRTLSAAELMRRADIATHRAKVAGRNSVAVFDDSMHANLAHRMDVENSLHGAIGRREMHLYHQPIIDLATGSVSGFESLIRWQRGDSMVSPGDFIPIAEDTGIICEIGAWALHEALGELRGWIDDGVVAPTTTISVNVSPRQVADPDFADIVRQALHDTGMPPNLLWIEITESMMLDEPELAERTLREIRATGVQIALDDFGTGYSSLSLLQQFPIQRIKIDRAFVSGIAEQGNDRSLVRTVIAMAQSMGLDVVAEGVETVQQLSVLSELDCDKAQGFLISRPVPADAMRSTMVAMDAFGSLSIFGRSDTPLFAPITRPDEADRPQEHRFAISVGGMSSRPLGQPVL